MIYPTVEQIAAEVRQCLDAGDQTAAMRVLADGVNRLHWAVDAGQLDDAIGQEPPSTGDIRWDTLLAASVRYRLHAIGVDPPAWTLKPPLPKFFAPFAWTKEKFYLDWAGAPAEFLRVGILMHERELSTA
ncbi:MAG: hypothetical protein LBR58_03800 [Propionibacteriaceae bacterium]|jgi:hypothetical protein|nr:hypothetical protein [Propionibacteriaceae bacterium]